MVGYLIVFWTPRSYVVVVPDFNVAIGSTLLVDSILAYCIPDPLHPILGLSQGEDSIVPFLYRPVAYSTASALCHEESLMCTGLGLGSSLPLSSPSLSSLSLGSPLPPSFAPLSSSLPLVLTPPGFPSSSSFASSLPSLASLAPFLVASSSIASFGSSLPSPAPPGFPVAPPVHPLAPPVGLRPHVPSLAPSVAPSLFCVSSRVLSAPGASPLLPSSAAATASFPHAPVPPSSCFPFVSASADMIISWSLPTMPSCSAPFLCSVSAPTHSKVFPVFSLGSSAAPHPSSSSLLPLALAAPLSTFLGLLVSPVFLWRLGGSWRSCFGWCGSLLVAWLWFGFCWRFWCLGFSQRCVHLLQF